MPLLERDTIPSEIIEPHLKRFLMIQIESVGCGLTTPDQARKYLEGVSYFVSVSCGIHARFATSNEFDRFIRLTDKKMIEICKEVINK